MQTMEEIGFNVIDAILSNSDKYPQLYILASLPPETLEQLNQQMFASDTPPDKEAIKSVLEANGIEIEKFLAEFSQLNDEIGIAEQIIGFQAENEYNLSENTDFIEAPLTYAETGGEDPVYANQTGTVGDALWEALLTGAVQDPMHGEAYITTLKTPDSNSNKALALVKEEGIGLAPNNITNAQNAASENALSGYNITRTDEGTFFDATTGEQLADSPQDMADLLLGAGLTADIMAESVADSQGHGLPREAQCKSENPFAACPSK
jgi:hypothetical protein